MKKIRISLLLFLLISANTAFPQAEDITKQFNDAYRAFQSLNQDGKPEESLEFAKNTLDLGLSLFDESSETTAALSYNYALNLLDVGQQKESAKEFRKTVKIYTQVFGRDSESLASVYFDDGRAISMEHPHSILPTSMYRPVLFLAKKLTQKQQNVFLRKHSIFMKTNLEGTICILR